MVAAKVAIPVGPASSVKDTLPNPRRFRLHHGMVCALNRIVYLRGVFSRGMTALHKATGLGNSFSFLDARLFSLGVLSV